MDFNKKNVKTLFGAALFCIVFYLGLNHIDVVAGAVGHVLSIFFPFILGAGIAFVINVPMVKVEKLLFSKSDKLKGARRPISFVIVLAAVIGVITIAIYIVIPQLAQTLIIIARTLPGAFEDLNNFLVSSSYFDFMKDLINDISVDWGEIASNVASFMKEAAAGMVDSGIGAISNIIGAVASFFIGFVFAVYILMSKEKLAVQFKRLFYAVFREKTADKILYVFSIAQKTFARFISGQCLEACILGMMFFVAMTVFRLPYAMLIAVLIAFTALIPIVGAFIGCIIGALLILTINPFKALMFVIMFLVLQQIEGNFVYPHVVGNSVGLPSIWVLVAVTVGAKLMGVAGMVIFIPITSVLYTLLRLFVKYKLNIRKLNPDKWEKPIIVGEEILTNIKAEDKPEA